MKYFTRKDKTSEVQGPFTTDQLLTQLESGSLSKDSLASSDVGGTITQLRRYRDCDWFPLARILDLRHLRNAIKTECPQCSQHIEADDDMVGMAVSCPTCQADFTIPEMTKPKAPAIHPALQYLAQQEPPKAVAACIKTFSNLGLLAALCGPIIFIFLMSYKDERGPFTYVLGLGMTFWGVLGLVAGYGMKRRLAWSRTLGYVLAVLILPGMVTIVPAIFAFINLSKDDWKTWLTD